MICTSCRAEMDAGAHFCPSCGATVVQSRAGPSPAGQVPGAGQSAYRGSPSAPWSYPAVPAAAGRVTRNLRPLASLWMVYEALRAFGGVVGLLVITAIGGGHYGPLVWMVGSPVPSYLHSGAWMGFPVPAIIVSALLASGLALVTGIGLLRMRRWGRTLALIAAVLALFKFPLGTALGAYTLWVLSPTRAGTEYDALAGQT